MAITLSPVFIPPAESFCGIRVSHYSGWETREGEAAGSSDAETSVPFPAVKISRCEYLAAFVQYDQIYPQVRNITVPQGGHGQRALHHDPAS